MRRVKMSSRPVERFQQRHDVDAAALQHRALAEVEIVEAVFLDLRAHRRFRPGQEARAHAKSAGAEAKVEARRLKLRIGERLSGQDRAAGEGAQLLERQHAGIGVGPLGLDLVHCPQRSRAPPRRCNLAPVPAQSSCRRRGLNARPQALGEHGSARFFAYARDLFRHIAHRLMRGG
jgi:hypothetical protein